MGYRSEEARLTPRVTLIRSRVGLKGDFEPLVQNADEILPAYAVKTQI